MAALCLLHSALAPAANAQGIPPVVATSQSTYATGFAGYLTKTVIDGSGNLFATDSTNGRLWEVPAGSTSPTQIFLQNTASTAGATVTAVRITNQGSGYTTAPTVTLTGGGYTTAATATATISAAGQVTAVRIVTAGAGYTSAPTVTFSAPTGTGGVQATGTATLQPILGLTSNHGIAVDKSGDIVVGTGYNGPIYFLPNKNGVICTTCNAAGTAPLDLTGAYGVGTLDGYYLVVADAAFDNASNLYVAVNACHGTGPCGMSGDSILLFKNINNSTTATTIAAAGTATIFIGALPGGKPALNIALDTNGHLFYVDGTNAYVVSTAATTPTPTVIGTFTAPTGISVDSLGDVFVVDSSLKLLYEIPNENGTLNPADEFVVASLTNPYYSSAFDQAGNIYVPDANDQLISLIRPGVLNLGTTAVAATSATGTMSYRFNAAETFTSIGVLQGSGAATEFTKTGGTCAANTAYIIGGSCTVTATFKPAEPGARTGAIVLQPATGKAISTAYLYGTGAGAAVTIDPGTQTTLTGTASTAFASPSAIAYDAVGNLYTADATANTVFVTPAGATAATSQIGGIVGTKGTLLSGPKGVTADGAGNVFIADTGNAQIVEIPNENGTLTTADQIAFKLPTTSGAPAPTPTGIRAAADGSLYVADTSNNRVLRYNTAEGPGLFTQTTVGAGFTAPTGVTTDAAGNVYVLDGGAAGRITQVNPYLGASSVLVGQLPSPTSIAVDAANNLYVVLSGNNTVVLLPNSGGAVSTSSKLSLGNNLVTPTGVAIDAFGNVAISDSGSASVAAADFRLARTAGNVNFGNVNIQLSSSAQQATLTSAGTLPLVFNTPYETLTGATADFQMQTPANACASAETLATGSSCAVSVIFQPITTGALSETYAFSSNAVNAPSSAVFQGFATNLSLTTTTLSITPSLTPSFGQTVVVTASVTASRAGYTPTGLVTFFVDSTKVGTASLSLTAPYTATFTFSFANQNALTAGSHVISASYSGDAANAGSTAATPLNVTVAKSTPTVSLTVVPGYAVAPNSSLVFNIVVTPSVAYTPTGTVSLYLAGTTTLVGSVTLSPSTGSTATAQIALTGTATSPGGVFSLGQYQVVAVYSGDLNFNTASSQNAAVSVRNTGYDVTVANPNLTVRAGSSTSTTITITTVGGYGLHSATNASGTTVAQSLYVAIDYMCANLPANTSCQFAPGQLLVNSFNMNDPCTLAIPTPTCGYPCTTLTFGYPGYCTDPNFQNSYAVTLTIVTDVPPVGYSALGNGLLWPLSVLSLAVLTLLHRRRLRPVALLTAVLLLSATFGASGCGSGEPGHASPTGTTAFTVNFNGANSPTVALPLVTRTLPMTLTITN